MDKGKIDKNNLEKIYINAKKNDEKCTEIDKRLLKRAEEGLTKKSEAK
jgi:hypothetical protein